MPYLSRQQLSEEELERLEEACDMALELNASKHRIYEYVESRMSFIAPNLSLIIGASAAAKIMGEAWGPSLGGVGGRPRRDPRSILRCGAGLASPDSLLCPAQVWQVA